MGGFCVCVLLSVFGALHCENFPPVWLCSHVFWVLEMIAWVVLQAEGGKKGK